MRSVSRLSIGLRLASAALILGACTGTTEPPPQRTPVSVADRVDSIDRNLLVGTWQCREMNPYPGAPAHTTTVTYRADGTFAGEGSTGGAMSGLSLQSSAKWRIEGDQLVMSDQDSSATSENPVLSVLGSLGSAIADQMTAGETARSDILQLDSGHLVWRVAGIEDPPVMSCTR
jgi:hypothetical protein